MPAVDPDMQSDLQAEERHIQEILSDSIRILCKNAVDYKHSLTIDGLVGIRVDNEKVLLVKIQNALQTIECAAGQAAGVQQLSGPWRKRHADADDGGDDDDDGHVPKAKVRCLWY